VNHGQHFVMDRRWRGRSMRATPSHLPLRNDSILGRPVVLPSSKSAAGAELRPPGADGARAGQGVLITELQAEPWTDFDVHLVTPANPSRNLDHRKLERNFEYACRSGARVYLWGGEWWLYQRDRHGDGSWMEQARRHATTAGGSILAVRLVRSLRHVGTIAGQYFARGRAQAARARSGEASRASPATGSARPRNHGGRNAPSASTPPNDRRLRAEGHPIAPGTTGEISPRASTGTGEGRRPPSPGADVLLEVTRPTSPCTNIAGSFAKGDFVRISEKVNPGWSRVYARVITGGTVRPGDTIALEDA
jgi:hypothetical protein